MARKSFTVTVGSGSQDNAGGIAIYRPVASDASTVPDAAAVSTDVAAVVAAAVAVAADVATLVSDGASPTQAHVTALNGHYTTLASAISAAGTAASGGISADVVISYDTTKVTTKNQLGAALLAALPIVGASATLT